MVDSMWGHSVPFVMVRWEMGNPFSGALAVPSSPAHPGRRCPPHLEGQVLFSGGAGPGAQAR